MKIDRNDPRLTAYALGELDPEERAAIESELARNPGLQQELEEIRRTAELVSSALAAEPTSLLAETQVQEIIAKAEESKRARPLLRTIVLLGSLPAAACITLLFFLAGPEMDQTSQVDRLASLHQEQQSFRNPALLSPETDASVPALKESSDSAPAEAQTVSIPAGPQPEAKDGLSVNGVQHSPFPVPPPTGEPDTRLRARYGSGARPRPNKPSISELESRAPQPEAQTYRMDPALMKRYGLIPRTESEKMEELAPSPAPVTLFERGLSSLGKSLSRPEASLPQRERDWNTEAYDAIVENAFLDAGANPLSTFSIDVDTASYANVRRYLRQGTLPPQGAVRIEELVNYFSYDYPEPKPGQPFSVHLEVADCPWNTEHHLLRIGLKGRSLDQTKRPASNLVFLIDVSGSMRPDNKLPLLKRAMRMLVENLSDNDSVAIVVYAGSSGLVLPSTSCDRKEEILQALERLEAGGSTNGGEGVGLAYATAVGSFIRNGINRVILCTDGDFNVGVTSQSELVRMIESKAKAGIFLSVLGFGMGNLKDSNLEKLADKGNGHYAYIDSLYEGRKVLVEEMGATLMTIAKDVKIQIEFNPAKIGAYRLVGYENRLLRKEDFNDDTKDAGEIGAGHTVTALYELVPAGARKAGLTPAVDPLKYQNPPQAAGRFPEERLTVKLRYKEPDKDQSKLLEFVAPDAVGPYAQASTDFKFASAVAAFGMVLRDSQFKGTASHDSILELAEEGLGKDPFGYRREFLELVRSAQRLQTGPVQEPR
jgi:Ca-activated chloride channel family protein